MTPFDKTSPLAENTGVIMWGASKIRHTSASIHCPKSNRFFRLSASQITENAASPFCRNLTISRYFVSPNRLRKIHNRSSCAAFAGAYGRYGYIRKSTAAPGECASQYTGCCHYRSPLSQAATGLQKTAPEAARKTGIFSIFGSFTPLIIISSTGSHHVSIPCDLRCP